MLGESDPNAPLWSNRVNLDKRVRSDHPLRKVNAVLDLSFVRAQVAKNKIKELKRGSPGSRFYN
jgi:hypothetical protein